MALTYTDASGNAWYVDNYGNLNNATKSGTSQDALDSTSANLYIGSATYPTYLSWGTAAVSGNTQTVTGTASGSGITLTRKTYIGDGFVRVLEVVSNTGTSATTVRVSLGDNIYYDSSTQTIATSSGDTTRTTADDWSAYGNSYNTSSPKLVHVVSGGAGSPTSVSQASADSPETSFNLSLAGGETKVVMHFYALSSDTAGATTIGNSLSGLTNGAYLAGMTTDELNALANFTQDITASVTTTLASYQLNLTLTGTATINGTGNDHDNLIRGNSANNLLNGLGGNDTLDGGGGADTMAGGTGNDTYIVDSSGDVVNENANEGIDTVKTSVTYSIASKPYIENITLIGSASINATGNTANNILDGSLNSAANTLTGGAGNDTYIVGTGDVVVELANEGTDTVVSSSTLTLGANLENLVLTGSANVNGTGNTLNNSLTGNAGQNNLSGGDGNDTLDGGAGADTLVGGIGNDTYKVDNAKDIVTEGASAGTDTVISTVNYTLGANVENLTLSETAFRGTGNALANKITGNANDNLLDGSAGADTLEGGGGSDIYIVDNAGDVVTEAVSAGIDTVKTALNGYTLGLNVENGVMLGTAVTMNGNELNNRIVGNLSNNTISGGLGNDTLMGGGGNDSLSGGDGNDLLVGDQGAPEAQVASAEAVVNGQSVVLNLSAPETATGTVKVSGTISSVSLGQAGVNLVYVIDHSGSMSGSFSGSVNVPDMNGDGSSNTTMDAAIASLQKLNQSIISSGMGSQVRVSLVQFDDTAETIYSGAPGFDGDGNGVADLVDSLKTLRPDGGTAYNTALTEVQNQLAQAGSGKNIVFFISDGAPTDGTTYQATAEQIRGMGQGGTVIRAVGTGAGASENPLDLLDDGIDNGSAIIVMNPEELDASLLNTSVLNVAETAWIEIYKNGEMVDLIGADRFTVGPLGIQFESTQIALNSTGTDQITAKMMTMDSNGAMVQTSLPIKIGDFVSNDTLVGGIGNDTLDGGAGTDSMVGGVGDDIYVVDNTGDIVVENASEGIDKVVSKLATYTLSANMENLDLVGTAVTGNGNALNNIITGNAGNNKLTGDAGNDSLVGGLGNDTLDGGSGNDTMEGGAGNDTYYVDSTSDYVNELSNDVGTDTVVTTLDTSLGGYVNGVSYSKSYSYIENLTLAQGSTAITGIGAESIDNVLIGNSNVNKLYGLGGNDTLNGGAGADTMDGGTGNDTYYVDNVGDVLVDASGIDTVVSSVNGFVLASGFENLTLANLSSVTTGTGNSLANKLTGNSYANVLNGGGGADTMAGGLGNDTYYVDNAFDQVVEASGAGTDTVNSSVSYMLTANVENLRLSGTSSIGGAGNTLANTITGNAGANRLLGYGGNDKLDGAAGNDTLIGGDGADTLIGGAGADVLTGGNGNDIFVVNALSETGTTSAAWDVITDFVRGQDKINLSALDADTATASTNEAFSSFIASTDSFTATGQLKFLDGVLYGNTDMDADAEFAIQLTGITTLTTADLVL